MVRFKNRYQLCELVWVDGHVDESLNSSALYTAVREVLIAMFGDWGYASVLTSFQVKYWNYHTNLCIVRSARDHYRMVWTAMTFATRIKGRAVTFRSLHVSGTIRSCQQAAIRHTRAVLALTQNAKTESAPAGTVPTVLTTTGEPVATPLVAPSALTKSIPLVSTATPVTSEPAMATRAAGLKRKAEQLLQQAETEIRALET